MKRIEYRIENIRINGHAPREQQLAEALNELGKQGWRVSDIELTSGSSVQQSPVQVLIEREVGETESFRRLMMPGA